MAAMVTWAEVSNLASTDWLKEAEWRVEAERFVEEVDNDRDGKIWLKEVVQSEVGMEAGEEAVVRAFNSLDADHQRGWLDPSQCTAFYFLFTHHRRACQFCHKLLLPGSAFTCSVCLPVAHSSHSPVFTLCAACLASPDSFDSSFVDAAGNETASTKTTTPRHHHSFNSASSVSSSIPRPHPHPRHLFLHDLLLFRNFLSRPPPAAAAATSSSATRAGDGDEGPRPYKVIDQTIKQCCICGDYHEPNIQGLMAQFHMAKKKDSPEDYVCEWCFSYFCSKCGQRIRDSTSRAEPGKWLQKYMCPNCHSNMATVDRYDIFLQRLKHELSSAELLKNCKTCEIKHRQGLLTGSVGGVAIASRPTPAAAAAASPTGLVVRNMGGLGMNPLAAANLMGGGGQQQQQHLLHVGSGRGGLNNNMNMGGGRLSVSPFAHVGDRDGMGSRDRQLLAAGRATDTDRDQHQQRGLNNNDPHPATRLPFQHPSAAQFNNMQLGPR